MKLQKSLASSITATALVALSSFLAPVPVSAADHGDAPALAQDLGCDVNDVFLLSGNPAQW